MEALVDQGGEETKTAAYESASPQPVLTEAREDLEVGDIILEINGKTSGDMESLAGLLSTLQPRQRIAVLALDHRTGNTGYVQVVIR